MIPRAISNPGGLRKIEAGWYETRDGRYQVINMTGARDEYRGSGEFWELREFRSRHVIQVCSRLDDARRTLKDIYDNAETR